MSDAVSTSAIGASNEAQTPENTTAPFEQLPEPPRKSSGFTKEMRDEKMKSGWIPPHLRPRQKKDVDPAVVASARAYTVDLPQMALTSDMVAKVVSTLRNEGWTPPTQTQVTPVVSVDNLLEALVQKLVAIENDGQYRSIWLHFFQHGGVYTGPNYLQELQAACDYLNSKRSVG